LTDGGNLSGALTATLTLSNVLGADGAAYTVVVTNSVSAATSAPPAILTVIDPVIISQPSSRTNHARTTASFSAGVNGTVPTCQWLKNGAPIDQATGTVLSLPSVSASDVAAYNLFVSNAYGTVTSATATLSVVSPLLIQSIVVTGDLATISWSAIPGNYYTLQQKNALEDSNWNHVLPPVQAAGASAAATDSLIGATQRFYRVSLLP
jgi:hypothetical protein